jgi:hypothetical protein
MKGYVKLFYFEDLLLGKGTSVGFEPGNSLCHDGFPVRARGLYEWTVHKKLCQRIRLHLALRATYERDKAFKHHYRHGYLLSSGFEPLLRLSIV